MKRRSRLAASLAALAGMLFLQTAIAFAPCEMPGRSAAVARAMAMAAMPDCHEADEANLCLAHCASEDQTVLKVPLDLPQLAMPSATPFIGLPKNIFVAAAKPAPYLAAAGPPPRILFQSFLL
jgi:hypothetical protein